VKAQKSHGSLFFCRATLPLAQDHGKMHVDSRKLFQDRVPRRTLIILVVSIVIAGNLWCVR